MFFFPFLYLRTKKLKFKRLPYPYTNTTRNNKTFTAPITAFSRYWTSLPFNLHSEKKSCVGMGGWTASTFLHLLWDAKGLQLRNSHDVTQFYLSVNKVFRILQFLVPSARISNSTFWERKFLNSLLSKLLLFRTLSCKFTLHQKARLYGFVPFWRTQRVTMVAGISKTQKTSFLFRKCFFLEKKTKFGFGRCHVTFFNALRKSRENIYYTLGEKPEKPLFQDSTHCLLLYCIVRWSNCRVGWFCVLNIYRL